MIQPLKSKARKGQIMRRRGAQEPPVDWIGFCLRSTSLPGTGRGWSLQSGQTPLRRTHQLSRPQLYHTHNPSQTTVSHTRTYKPVTTQLCCHTHTHKFVTHTNLSPHNLVTENFSHKFLTHTHNSSHTSFECSILHHLPSPFFLLRSA